MHLTRTERWILSNQYRILEALYPAEAKRLSEIRDAVECGYELQVPPPYIYPDEETLSSEQCKQVLDILDMYTALQRSYSALSDTSGIDAARLKFPGFDGNNETTLLSYADYFCEHDGGRFTDLDRARHFNSYVPMLGRYVPMLAVWKSLDERQEMNREQIIKLLSAPHR